jgi:hypothetical protein
VEEDPAYEGAEDEGRSGQEGTKRILQHYSTYAPDEARVKGEGEDQHAYAHGF